MLGINRGYQKESSEVLNVMMWINMKYPTNSLAFQQKLREMNRGRCHITHFAKWLPVNVCNDYTAFLKRKSHVMNLTEIPSFSLPPFLLCKQGKWQHNPTERNRMFPKSPHHGETVAWFLCSQRQQLSNSPRGHTKVSDFTCQVHSQPHTQYSMINCGQTEPGNTSILQTLCM